MTLKNKTTRILSALLIIAMILPSVLLFKPKQANAVLGFGDIVFDVPTEITTAKDLVITILAQVIMTVEKRLLQQLTQSTVNWINSGFSGNPLYLQNSQSFFQDIAKYEIKNLVNLFGYDAARFPFGKDYSLNIINSYKAQLADNTQYTLSKVINDPTLLQSYQNNFTTGGWNAFLINTQYPQNNYIEFNIIANNQLSQKLQGTVQTKAQQVQTTLQQGMGFLSPTTCPSNPDYNNGVNEFDQPAFDESKFASDYFKAHPSPTSQTAAEVEQSNQDYKVAYDIAWTEWSKKSYCPNGLVATTPGSVVANQITTAMGSTFRQSELGAALGNSIGAILDTLVSHFLNKGLNGLSSTVNQAPLPDTWTYYGNTLGNTNNPGGTNTPITPTTPTTPAPVANFNNPGSAPSVSVSDTSGANVTLSGGTQPYTIVTQPDSAMAIGYIAENTLIIAGTGTTTGQTSIVVRDSSGKTITIPITATGADTTLNNPPVDTSNPSNPTEPTEPTGPPEAPIGSLDPSQATIVYGPSNVATWAQTTTISNINVNPNGAVSVDFDKKNGSGRWPDQFGGPGVSSSDTIQYTIWLFENVGGQWYGAGEIQMWHDRADTGAGLPIKEQLRTNWVYNAPPMSSHVLQSGEQVGFMVTAGNDRGSAATSILERSNIVLVTLP